MNETRNFIFKTARNIIDSKKITSPTQDELKTIVKKSLDMGKMMFDVDETDELWLKCILMQSYTISMDDFKILEGSERRRPWLKEFKSSHDNDTWYFWNRYREHLLINKKYPVNVVDKLDNLTDTILDNTFYPGDKNISIAKKGLVVGQVQSGKTSNYTGVICKAADAGYKIIIVLAGMLNNLRSQTQLRLEEDFLGFETRSLERKNSVGVGNINRDKTPRPVISLTSSLEDGDFDIRHANSFNFDTDAPILIVTKKNATVLKKINKWLESKEKETIDSKKKITTKPLLLIDDEADNASINTGKPEDDPTAINKQIRDILGQFSRTAYIGYTATPFANMFITVDKDDDLYPSDFIINLKAPTNYIGPNYIFGTFATPCEEQEKLLPIVEVVDDFLNEIPQRHKNEDMLPGTLPESMSTAIKCFILTCALRRTRGQENEHNSMLVHVSRFQRWQHWIKELVERKFNYYKNGITQNDAQTYAEFEKLYEEGEGTLLSYKEITDRVKNSAHRDSISHIQNPTWEEVGRALYPAVQKIQIKEVNGSAGDALEYKENQDKGISIIAIGGDKLSRGLTLEGLSVSYFLRASRMYDSLMQMGRWFGYRDGYLDLCRLFISEELNEWLKHISLVSDELRNQFDEMAITHSTPEEYITTIRNHPGRLQITALNKMRSAQKVKASWAGTLLETYQFHTDKETINSNYHATDEFVSSLGGCVPGLSSVNKLVWRNIDVERIISFFEKYKTSGTLVKFHMPSVINYIKSCNKDNELTNWSVSLFSKEQKVTENTPKFSFDNGQITFHTFSRTRDDRSKTTDIYQLGRSHLLADRYEEMADIEKDVQKEALAEYKRLDPKWKESYPQAQWFRRNKRDPDNPMLMIYPLNAEKASYKDLKFDETDTPFIGLAIVFPRDEFERPEEYAINESLFQNLVDSQSDIIK